MGSGQLSATAAYAERVGTRRGPGVPSSIPGNEGDDLRRGGRRSSVERGYLLLADIGGYTHYLSGVELEHSTDILADLLGVVVEQLRGTFEVHKLEGDAVFCCGSDTSVAGGAVNATVEASYFAFAGRLQAIARATTCPCQACHQVLSLSLKFVVHNGEYARQRVDRRGRIAGPEVIVAHRLLKNGVTNQTGLNGYALFTDACVERIGLGAAPAGMGRHTERVEDIGQVDGQVLDLEARWQEELARRVVYVRPEEANIVFDWAETSVPPPVAWEYLTSPTKQLLWLADREEHKNPRGVQGVGTTNHCVHGKLLWSNEILDWKPYRYLSYRTQDRVLGPFLSTDEITPLEGEPAGACRTAPRRWAAGGSGCCSGSSLARDKRFLSWPARGCVICWRTSSRSISRARLDPARRFKYGCLNEQR